MADADDKTRRLAEKAAQIIADLGETGQRIAEQHRTQEPGKLPKPPRRVMVGLTERQFDHLHDVAFRAGVSVSYIGQQAILEFLIAAERGEVLLLPESFGPKPGHA